MANKSLGKEFLQEMVNVYAECGCSKAAAAAALGIPEQTFKSRIAQAARAGIVIPKRPDDADGIIKAYRSNIERSESIKTIKTLERRVISLENELAASLAVKSALSSYKIVPDKMAKSEAVAVWEASDWHVGERVTLGQTNGINEYNPKIAKQRAEQFFVHGLRLTNMMARDVTIKTIVLALLGDFITGHLHQAAVESNHFAPVDETIYAQKLLVSGIQYLLDSSKYDLVIPCHSGNHGRTTKFSEFGLENGHSHEFFMYHSMRDHFKSNKRVKFIISEGAHTYLDVFGMPLRFLHGHDIKYGGGVGGITIPVKKAISAWDRARPAYLSCFGHFHERLDGGNFVANGSMIGYNSFALSIKATAEPPAQQLFLIDKMRGKTFTAPILFDV